MKNRHIVITPLFVLLLALQGCATAPDKIEAITASPQAFAGMSCGQLVSTLNEKYQALSVYSQAQTKKSKSDVTSSLIIGIPGSVFTGDYEKQIATLKGEVDALSSALDTQQCDLSQLVETPDVSDITVEDLQTTD